MNDCDPLPKLDVMVACAAWQEAIPDLSDLAEHCYRETSDALENGLGGSVCILLTQDKDVQDLNARFRHQDKPTNVLSFPGDKKSGQLGDIALAFETCEREAAAAGLPISHHTAHLIVHGLLHLVGYDHMDEAEASEMETLEIDILATLNIANPYLEPLVGDQRQKSGE